ncbi:hypothetical protein N7451_004175 [Penicillium sp. IBT 35674x]|nr:hypothetical protein N7451_004175 [Penicillium sp. IBT 35674x]
MTSKDKKLRIASLGSSFAAAKELDADLTDLSVSGATLLNITVDPQTAPFGNDIFPPQIQSVPEDADIITVTAGGNDIGYIGNMMQDAASATLLGSVAITVIRGVKYIASFFSQSRVQAATTISPEELVERLGDTLDKIHARAPNARIYLVEYVAVLGPSTKPRIDIPFDQERIDYHSQVASKLQNASAVAAATRSDWCERVPIHELSLKHALGSDEPWVGGFNLSSVMQKGPVLHPNLDGMKAVAGILLETIRKGTPGQAE